MPALGTLEIVAHRGAGTDIVPPNELGAKRPSAPPENTLPAFAWGWRRGTSCELDVHLTRDDRLVVIHDGTTGRTCDRDLPVAESTLAELQALDAGKKKGVLWSGLRLPTLEEVFEVMPDGRRLYVELKNGPGIVDPLVESIRQAGRGPDQIVFISFNIDAIGAIKQVLPDYSCYLIVSFPSRPTDGTRSAVYQSVDPSDPRRLKPRSVRREPARPGDYGDLYQALIDLVRRPVARKGAVGLDGLDVSWYQPESFAAAMRESGIAWGCWTVDTADAAVLMRSRGAVQLTTNCVDDIRDVLEHVPEEC